MVMGTLYVGTGAGGDGECAGHITPQKHFAYAETVYFDVLYEAFGCDSFPAGDAILYWESIPGNWVENNRAHTPAGVGYVYWKNWSQLGSRVAQHYKITFNTLEYDFWIDGPPATPTPVPTPTPLPVSIGFEAYGDGDPNDGYGKINVYRNLVFQFTIDSTKDYYVNWTPGDWITVTAIPSQGYQLNYITDEIWHKFIYTSTWESILSQKGAHILVSFTKVRPPTPTPTPTPSPPETFDITFISSPDGTKINIDGVDRN